MCDSQNPTVVVRPEDEVVNRNTVEQETSSMKWWAAFLYAILALLVFNALAYNLTNALITAIGLPSILKAPGVPNAAGLILHVIIYFFLVRLIMW